MAHRDGYNVPYGDYNVCWHSDQERRITYWNLNNWYIAGSGYSDRNIQGLGTSRHYQGFWASGNTGLDARHNGLPLVWHTLDKSAGIDVGASDHDDTYQPGSFTVPGGGTPNYVPKPYR